VIVALLSLVELNGQVAKASQQALEKPSPSLTATSLTKPSAIRKLHGARAGPPTVAPRETGYPHV